MSIGDERHPRGPASRPGRFSTKPQSDQEGSLSEQSRPAQTGPSSSGQGRRGGGARGNDVPDRNDDVRRRERVLWLIGPRGKAYQFVPRSADGTRGTLRSFLTRTVFSKRGNPVTVTKIGDTMEVSR